MLVVDPIKRISLQDVRNHPWFTRDLPDYLESLPMQSDPIPDDIDESIVAELSKKISYPREAILRALKDKRESNEVKVAYQLVVDHRQLLANARQSRSHAARDFVLGLSPPATKPALLVEPINIQPSLSVPPSECEFSINTSITVLSSSLPPVDELSALVPARIRLQHSRSLSNPPPFNPVSTGHSPVRRTSLRRTSTLDTPDSPRQRSQPPQNSPRLGLQAKIAHKPVRPRWYFGIRSGSPPTEVMRQLVRGAERLGLEWKSTDPFRLRLRRIVPHDSDFIVVKADVQLFRVDGRTYLLDFKYVPPSQTIYNLSRTTSFSDSERRSLRQASNDSMGDMPFPASLPSNSRNFLGDSMRRLAMDMSSNMSIDGLPSSPANPADASPLGGYSIFPFFKLSADILLQLTSRRS